MKRTRSAPWTDERVRDALGEFLARKSQFPTAREFKDAGLGGLWDRLSRRRELGRWAQEFELQAPRHARPILWTEDRIEAELRLAIQELGGWPGRAVLEERGQAGLAAAITRRGGARYWRGRVGLGLPQQSWSDEQLECELRELAEELGSWPRGRDLLDAEQPGLCAAVKRRGGLGACAEWLGYSPRPGGGKEHWTEQRIREQLTPFLRGRTSWPTQGEFEAAGLGPLWHALSRRHALQRWAREFDLPEPRRGRRPRQPHAPADAAPSA